MTVPTPHRVAWRSLTGQVGYRVPGWRTQEQLSTVDDASIVLGVPALGLSPVVLGWRELDPDLWTDTQRSSVMEAQSGVIRWNARTPVWQNRGQWAKQPGYVQAGGAGALVYSTGGRDMERINRLLTVGRGFERDSTEEAWVDGGPILSSGRDLYLLRVEARKYENGSHVLAATDWSVRQTDCHMGSGCVFAATNDSHHQGSHNCAVRGEASSLRAEAVALDLLLDHTDPERDLVALTDSLSLMLILDGWDWQDFIPQIEFQRHQDVIVPLAVKLAARTGTTTLVKVK
eukprot:3895071-Rhodomonas_salina.1